MPEPKLTVLDAAKNALLQTVGDNHPGFFENLQFKHEVIRSSERMISATRIEEMGKLKGVTTFADVLSALQVLKDQFEKEEKLEKFNALAQAISAVRALMPEGPVVTPPPVI